MSTGGFAEEPGDLFPDLPPKPVLPPDHDAVIRNALRFTADEAYPDDLARPYEDTLLALTEREVVVVPAESLRAVLDGNASVDQWHWLRQAVKEDRNA